MHFSATYGAAEHTGNRAHEGVSAIRTLARVPQISVGSFVTGMSQLDRTAIQLRNALVVEGVFDEHAPQAGDRQARDAARAVVGLPRRNPRSRIGTWPTGFRLL